MTRAAEPFHHLRSRYLRSALLCLTLAAATLQFITLRWTPDCGGVSYGLPLPYVTASTASSLELVVDRGALAIDWLAYAVVFAAPSWLLARRLQKLRPCTAHWLLVTSCALVGALSSWQCSGVMWQKTPLYVREWRSVRPFVGLPGWGEHNEPACN